MSSSKGVLHYTGTNFFRQRLVLSILSGRPVRISEIRSDDANPGVREFETNLMQLLCTLTNGSLADVGPTGTEVFFKPGILVGGRFEFDCGTERGIGYYLETLCYLAPFGKSPLEVNLTGVTNCSSDLSPDVLKYAWLPVMRRFILNSESLDIKVIKRGFLPNAGGQVLFNSPICARLHTVQLEKPGKVRKVRGLAYSCRVSPTMGNRCMEVAKSNVKRYINDVYFHSDHRKGVEAGLSPGYGILLSAETTEGVFYVAEKMSNPSNSKQGPALPEDVGLQAVHSLFYEIYRGGCCDSTAQPLALLFMALCQKDVSKLMTGPLSDYAVNLLRHIKDFFGVVCKVDDYNPLSECGEADLRIGCLDKVKLSCVGVGFSNLSKVML